MSEGKNNQSISYRWWVSSLCGVAILYKEIIFFLFLSNKDDNAKNGGRKSVKIF